MVLPPSVFLVLVKTNHTTGPEKESAKTGPAATLKAEAFRK
jgi:hypothetical protein